MKPEVCPYNLGRGPVGAHIAKPSTLELSARPEQAAGFAVPGRGGTTGLPNVDRRWACWHAGMAWHHVRLSFLVNQTMNDWTRGRQRRDQPWPVFWVLLFQ